MAKTGVGGLRRIYNAFFYSLKGLRAGLKYEAAVRQELCLAVLMTALAAVIADSLTLFLILFILPWLTLAFELANSAIEAVVDRIGDEYHELSGRAKDLGSACVFVLLCLDVIAYAAALWRYYS
ncbi:MAG TPA: diacylglycerol kinase [Candidatus Avisuccinivibrio pullicola]|nr:diacylglycerol kinase [Candidatus Avisuccinivibrio pullicola]